MPHTHCLPRHLIQSLDIHLSSRNMERYTDENASLNPFRVPQDQVSKKIRSPIMAYSNNIVYTFVIEDGNHVRCHGLSDVWFDIERLGGAAITQQVGDYDTVSEGCEEWDLMSPVVGG
jgi:hypothetical protein